MYWDYYQEEPSFKFNTEIFGYHPYMSVSLSALAYLLFALVVVGSHKKGIFKKYAHTAFLILAYSFAIDIFEFGQNLYFIFNMPDQNPNAQGNKWSSRFDTVSLPTTVWACSLSQWLFVFHYFSSAFVDAIVSIYHFIVRFCGKKDRVTALYIAFGICLSISMGYLAYAFILGKESSHEWSLGPVVCRRFYTVHKQAAEIGLLFYMAIALFTRLFPMLTLIKGAAKKHNETGLTTFLLLSSLLAACLLILCIIGNLRVWDHHEPKVLLWIVQGLFTLQQYRFPVLCLLATLIVPEVRGSVLSTISDIIHFVLRRDISVTINVDLFHLKNGKKKHIEKVFTI